MHFMERVLTAGATPPQGVMYLQREIAPEVVKLLLQGQA